MRNATHGGSDGGKGMNWVIQRDPNLPENAKMSPWRGCLHILKGKGWCATNLAKPTQFTVEEEAYEIKKHLERENPESEFNVAIYEDVFPEAIKKVIPEVPAPPDKTKSAHPDAWDWGDDDDIPF